MSTDVAHLPRVARKHYGRYVAAIVVVAALAAIVVSFAGGQIEWSVVGQYLTAQAILTGVVNTIVMAVLAMILGVALGVLFAVMRMSSNPVTRGVSFLYTWIFRGTPQLLQLFLWFNLALVFPYVVIPGVFEARTVDLMTPFVAALLGLGICQGAYTSEVVRGGILSVDQGQTEAAQAIGMTRFQTMRRIVLPQAMRVILPPIGNEFISMVKLTSLASAIQYQEVLHSAQNVYYANNRVMELLFVATFWYLIVVTILSLGQMVVERRFSRGVKK
ncbi:amino acid ABC transporter permease [Nonomuraea purpurea]|uniref:Histidine/lysine/arginine/ornithine transport system permease protein HisM n=1 Tax=Nonomuraea purpurea TaxID=1849276 RepID=A0ABV8GHL9_9ACTN